MGHDSLRQNIQMIEQQIIARGVSDKRVLNAMAAIDRRLFVPDEHAAAAYEDHPLPLMPGATVSQPYIVGLMTELLNVQPTDKVLEVGTGSGYQAAVLGALSKEVWSVEFQIELVTYSIMKLEAAGVKNVFVVQGNGWQGLEAQAPFDRILVTAAPTTMPQALIDQLAPGGRMIVPVGSGPVQELEIVKKDETGNVATERHSSVKFVPLVHPDDTT